MREMGIVISHIPRGRNEEADKLAKWEREHPEIFKGASFPEWGSIDVVLGVHICILLFLLCFLLFFFFWNKIKLFIKKKKKKKKDVLKQANIG